MEHQEFMDYPERSDLKLVLDFVERWNKQDKESNLSQAALELENYLERVERQLVVNS